MIKVGYSLFIFLLISEKKINYNWIIKVGYSLFIFLYYGIRNF